MTDGLDEALHLERLKREIEGLDARGVQLKILQRLDLVVDQVGDHDLALFGSEDLAIEGVVACSNKNTQFRVETTTVMKVIRFMLPPTSVGTAVLLGKWAWSLLQAT